MSRLLVWLGIACHSLVGSGASEDRGPERDRPGRPNIVFLVADDMRPDAIGALGNAVIRTPHLDSLVAGGTVFLRAVCANPICTPSRAEILTGCSGFRNGVLDFGGRIPATTPRWARTMAQHGYRTYYVGKWHNDGRPSQHGYEESVGLFAGGGGQWAKPAVDWKGRPVTGYRGWVFQTDDGQKFPERGIGLTPNISGELADAAISILRRKHDRPFFLHVNFTAPHDPLLWPPGPEFRYPADRIPLPSNFLPEHPFDHGNATGRDEQLWPWPRTPQDVREELAVYYAVISHMDAQIGRILAALEEAGQADETVVFFASDHGLAIGSHGLRGKQNMYEHTIGVPLVVRGPGIPRGARSRAQVYLRDLFPTACELAGIPLPTSVDGQSLVPLLTGKAHSLRPEIFGYFRDAQRMIRTERWKLIHYPKVGRHQLFDLDNDPAEVHDLSQEPRWEAVRADLQDRLRTWQQSVAP